MRTATYASGLLVVLSCALGGPLAAAQDVHPERSGDGPGGLPALVRLPVAGAMSTGLVVAGHAGYGYTESVLGNADSHHRLTGALAASLRPIDWLAFVLRLRGAYDAHSGTLGADDGVLGEARLAARVSSSLSERFALGLELVLFVPGQSAPSLDFGATTLDASALLSWSPSTTLTVATTLGVRLDQSGSAAPERDQLSRADRLALGLSDSSALLLGLGASYTLASVELFGEVTADLLVGRGAPSITQSPLRLAAGARIRLTDGLTASFIAEASLSSRPALVTGEPLVPVEPRISLLAGLVWHTLRARPADTNAITDPRPHPTPPDPIPSGLTPPLATPTSASVIGIVRRSDGAPLVGATVRVEDADPPVAATTDAAGAYVLDGLPVGRELRLRVSAPGWNDTLITVVPSAGTPTETAAVMLTQTLPAGVIRGVLRSFRGGGAPLTGARVTVEPGGRSTRVGEHGEFEVEVPPGSYTVIIEAAGHESQRRTVTVEQLGVVVLNVDLRRSR